MKKSTGYATFPCIKIQQGQTELVMFSANAKLLWELLDVNRRDTDKNTGYQRAFSKERIKALATYVNDGNPIPTSLVASLDSAKVSEDGTSLTFTKKSGAGWVIDGQHRLLGAKEAEVEIELPVIAFVKLPLDRQIKQFVVINKEAKGVPTSLYYDLLKHLPPGKSEAELSKERAADLANDLKRDESSPFFGRITVMTSPKRGEISLTNFVRKVAPLVQPSKGKFHVYSEREQRQILANYYLGLGHSFPEIYDATDSIFFQTLGFGALMNALPTAFDLCIKNFHGFRMEDVISLLKKIDYFNFSDWKQYGTGNAAEMQAGGDLRQELLDAFGGDEEAKGGSLRL